MDLFIIYKKKPSYKPLLRALVKYIHPRVTKPFKNLNVDDISVGDLDDQKID